ncbi:MAG: hypothetical protein UY73_C0039G0005 [Parcubacteria group bacterium GW2011_GWA2_52_8]|nr:MAG: hypothetical protein UY73_C0039G0005 [Parcubacteria group bacterium GW2011_GWA2_52_8]
MIGAEGGDVLMKSLHIVAMTLVWIGALNWGSCRYCGKEQMGAMQ